MDMAAKIGCSFSSSPFQRCTNLKFVNQKSGSQLTISDKDKLYRFMHGVPKLRGRLQKQQTALFVVSEDQSQISELETAVLVTENRDSNPEGIFPIGNSSFHLSGDDGKRGIVSFYNHPFSRDNEVVFSNSERTQSSILWFMGPAVLVASFVCPSLYLRGDLSVFFEGPLSTDFRILFFTEAIFYCGVAVFLLLLDHLKRPIQLDPTANNSDTLTPQLGQRISSVVTLVLSLTIPMVTMVLFRPLTGRVASVTLVPYLVGIVVQLTFQKYATNWRSPSWAAIPFIFQAYRLHQLNRAAKLVIDLLLEVRGAEVTSDNLVTCSSLSILLSVLQFLGVICIWSLSSFLMRFLPCSKPTPGYLRAE